MRWTNHKYLNGTTAYGYEYDYFLKDHLGNTRMVLTQEKDTAQYMATMEAAYRATELQLFYNIAQSCYARSAVSGYPSDPTTNPNDSIAKVNGSGQKTGPSLLLRVMSGDVVDIATKSFYKSGGTVNSPNSTLTDVVNSLAGGVVTATNGAHGVVTDLSNTSNGPVYAAINSFLPGNDPNTTGKPKAYLNWVLLDDQFRYVNSYPQSGAIVVGNADVLNTLAYSGIPITKNGYLYVWVSNETPGWDVFFDNLSVKTYSGPITEETHYYPFGLTMAGISSKAAGAVENYYKFNKGSELQHKEFSDGSGLELYATNFRNLDPQLGRWWQIDPKPDFAQSTYSAMGNNPVLINDPLGDTVRGFSNSSAQKLMNTIKNSFQGNKTTQALFKLGKDGKTFQSINETAFASATKNLSKKQLALAVAYMQAINGNSDQVVSMVSRGQSLGSQISSLLPGNKKGSDIDANMGGGVNIPYGQNGTLSVIVTNSTARVGDFVDPATGQHVTRSSSAGELVAHEMLGHGMGRTSGSTNFGYQDAIEMTNLYMGSQGSTLYRDGSNHGGYSGTPLKEGDAKSIPSMYQNEVNGASAVQDTEKLFGSTFN